MFDHFLSILTGPCGVSSGTSILVCCSGGMDSMVLIDLAIRAADCLDLRVGVVHVDHGIRGEASHRDARFVKSQCARLGIESFLYELNMDEHTANLEEEARLRRYQAISDCMADHGFSIAATGHTMDDQAETVLYRIIRGSGIRGLSGIGYRSTEGLIRPLLDFQRSQIRDYAVSKNIEFVQFLTVAVG